MQAPKLPHNSTTMLENIKMTDLVKNIFNWMKENIHIEYENPMTGKKERLGNPDLGRESDKMKRDMEEAERKLNGD